MNSEHTNDQKAGNAKPFLSRFGWLLFCWLACCAAINRYRWHTHDGTFDDYVPLQYTYQWMLYKIDPTYPVISGLALSVIWIVVLWKLWKHVEPEFKSEAGDDE